MSDATVGTFPIGIQSRGDFSEIPEVRMAIWVESRELGWRSLLNVANIMFWIKPYNPYVRARFAL
nr:hypothetical protein [Hymenobacter jeollabukensis]